MDDKCMCPNCPNNATETENSPYMNDYCDECTYERHDITYGAHSGQDSEKSRGILGYKHLGTITGRIKPKEDEA